jgi:hypothetical protein
MDPFESVRTIDDLIDANIRYFKGELDSSPYYPGPFVEGTTEKETPEMQQVIDGLVKINKLGFITTYGQGPLDETDELGDRIQQKIFVSGFLKNSRVEDFLSNLEKNKNIEYIACHKDGSILTNIKQWIQYNGHKGYTNCLTLLTDKNDIITDCHTYMSLMCLRQGEIESYNLYTQILLDNYSFINVQLRKMCNKRISGFVFCDADYLYDQIEKALTTKYDGWGADKMAELSKKEFPFFSSGFGRKNLLKKVNAEITYLHSL